MLASAVELEGPVALPRHYELPIDGRLPDYLVERNITPELAKYFDLRYCVEGKHAYVDPYTDQVKGQAFDMRILIPIYDLNGVMKTFQGRDVTAQQNADISFQCSCQHPGGFSITDITQLESKQSSSVRGLSMSWGLSAPYSTKRRSGTT